MQVRFLSHSIHSGVDRSKSPALRFGKSQIFMNGEQSDAGISPDFNRREFLKQTAVGVGLAATGAGALSQDVAEDALMPTVQIGAHKISRLILGSNPMLGYSHTSGLLSQMMSDYYTVENMGKLLERCLALGINTWQTSVSVKVDKALADLRQRGHDIQWIFLANSPHPRGYESAQRTDPAKQTHCGCCIMDR